MKTVLTLIVLFSLSACGKSGGIFNNGKGTNFQGSALQSSSAVLFVPHQYITGVSMSLFYPNQPQPYQINLNSSSPSANQALNAIYNNQISVPPSSSNSNGRFYNVQVEGTIGQSPCPMNPNVTCNTVAVNSISPF
ncbi:MAG: hypothetical protein ACOYL6_09320 [Bacteriovoracaceae bacterium]